MIAANNGHLLTFDNLSAWSPWLSDAFCRIASGGSFAVRRQPIERPRSKALSTPTRLLHTCGSL
jgi:hypothetical protein